MSEPHSIRETAKWASRRLLTGGLYILAITGTSAWDREPDSWWLFVRLGATAVFLATAVRRTVGHWHEDQEDA